ncbi:NAD(P)-binding protein [Trichodelitschia bisporula]|uniref:NAD(P)-binding protein n=1 Tax=Trichodelitschia bisporula TaxID=703511 RepID=A0A6G1HYL3_9PEZI|nr:NAD(P)-binding protein [Trichodelitschia bisporula]
MPIPIILEAAFGGLSKIPYSYTALKVLPCLLLAFFVKRYFGGAPNTSERKMHSKVIMMTGGTSGIGGAVARELASRGAQLVLLTHHELSDPFLVDYIMDMRKSTGNELITAEHVDLSSLHSIRVFATKWVDNAPPRRLDMIILCANTMTPLGGEATKTVDGLESNWAINYLANFHLLSILSPALRAQPPDRDVRVIFGMCSSYMGGSLLHVVPPVSDDKSKKPAKKAAPPNNVQFRPSTAYATSKLALFAFASAFQKHLSAYKRPDGFPMNSRVVVVDPGWTRSPGMRRFLTVGSLWGLLVYLVMYPFWWFVLKDETQGAQSFLFAAMDAELGRDEGGKFIKECKERVVMRSEVNDERLQKALWEESDQSIQTTEKASAIRRTVEKKQREEAEKDAERTEAKKESSTKQPGSRRGKKTAPAEI